MRSQYITDNEAHADIPRRDYIKMEGERKTTNPSTSSRLRLQQQMAQTRRTTNYSDDSEDERICEIDKRIAARKKELADQQKAAQKAANDPSQYVSNRAKMLKDQASNSPGKTIFTYI